MGGTKIKKMGMEPLFKIEKKRNPEILSRPRFLFVYSTVAFCFYVSIFVWQAKTTY